MYYHVFHSWYRTFGDLLICSPKSLYKKTRVEGNCQNAYVKGSGGPDPSYPSLLRPVCQACVKQPALIHTPSPPRGREKKDVTKMNFSSCSDHSWLINDSYIFFLYLRVWVFLFLLTSFFTAQNLGPMIQRLSCVFFILTSPFMT